MEFLIVLVIIHTDYEEPVRSNKFFAKDPKHKYNEQIMRLMLRLIRKYDKFRGHDIMTVARIYPHSRCPKIER